MNITTDPINIKRSIKEHCNIYGNKFNNFGEIEISLKNIIYENL